MSTEMLLQTFHATPIKLSPQNDCFPIISYSWCIFSGLWMKSFLQILRRVFTLISLIFTEVWFWAECSLYSFTNRSSLSELNSSRKPSDFSMSLIPSHYFLPSVSSLMYLRTDFRPKVFSKS